MLLKSLTVPLALLLLGSASAAPSDCTQSSCRRDGPFSNAQVSVALRTSMFNGGPMGARMTWTLKTSNYSGSLNYSANLFGQSKTVCSSDGVFCINDRLYLGSEYRFGYSLFYANQCSNYWATLTRKQTCTVSPGTGWRYCDYTMAMKSVTC